MLTDYFTCYNFNNTFPLSTKRKMHQNFKIVKFSM